jgi:hypothetical protein
VTESVVDVGSLRFNIRFEAQVGRDPLGGFSCGVKGGKMKLDISLLAGLISTVLILGGCEESEPIQPPDGDSFVRFVDKGAVVP